MADDFDYDLIIVGCGVGGHGAALHARSCGKSSHQGKKKPCSQPDVFRVAAQGSVRLVLWGKVVSIKVLL